MKQKLTLLLLCLAIVATSKAQESISSDKLWYDSPTDIWTEALPIGNGRIGAMIFGGVEREHIQFNEETLWTGEPIDYVKEGASKYLGEIRQLLFDGEQDEATQLALEQFMSNPIIQSQYQPFGDLYIDFEGHTNFSNYKRELDLGEAIHRVSYDVGDVAYERETFVSAPDQVMAIALSASKKGALNFALSLESLHEDMSVSIEDGAMILRVAVADGEDRGINYQSKLWGEAKLKIETDGDVQFAGGELVVRGGSKASIYLTAATNYVNYNDVSGEPRTKTDAIFNKLGGKSFSKIKRDHIKDYCELFDRFDINFSTNEKMLQPTNVRLLDFNSKGDDSDLIALYVKYGRYLMLSSSREGTYPANLQGIWNDKLIPMWASRYTANINVEMNYWIAELTNLSECHDAFFNLIEQVAETGERTAKEYYDASGWCMHHNTDIWRGSAAVNHSNHGIFQGGGGWVSLHFWDHYLYTGDKDFLGERGYPIMKGAAQFYNDVLVEDPKTGWLVTSPTNSPETGGLVYGATMDIEIINALFKACIEAADILSIDQEFADELASKLERMAPYQIGEHNQLQEWVEDRDNIKDKHRHVSHLWGVYPGKEINWEENPDMMRAAKQSLLYRGDDGTGWSLAWKISFWARFLDSERVYKLIEMMFRPVTTSKTGYGAGGGSYANLFCAHPPFQIDGNLGAPAGIIEMLMQSHLNRIDILPALPSKLPEGSISGVCARGGFELSFSWSEGKLNHIELLSKNGGECRIKYGDKIITINTKRGKRYDVTTELI